MLQVVMDICKIEHFLKILKLQKLILKERIQEYIMTFYLSAYIFHYINIKLNG